MRSPTQILALLRQHNLTQKLTTHGMQVAVARVDGVHHLPGSHCDYGWLSRRGAQFVDVGLLTYVTLPASGRCSQCSPQLGPTLRRTVGPTHHLFLALAALTAVAAFESAVAGGDITKIAAADRRMRAATARAKTWALDEETTEVIEQAVAAVSEVGDVIAAHREQVLATAAGELVPERLRQYVPVDETESLIVVDPAPEGHSLSGTARELVMVLRVPGAPKGSLVMHGPAFVREYFARRVVGGRADQYLDSCPCPAELVPVAARLWDPTNVGPMSVVAVAVSTAKNLCAEEDV